MKLEALKKDILHRIIETEREDILIEINTLLKAEKADFWDELTESQKNEIRLGLKQVENGETEKWEDFLNRAS
jgi:hypothetical protein